MMVLIRCNIIIDRNLRKLKQRKNVMLFILRTNTGEPLYKCAVDMSFNESERPRIVYTNEGKCKVKGNTIIITHFKIKANIISFNSDPKFFNRFSIKR